jgi:hypothetical protein
VQVMRGGAGNSCCVNALLAKQRGFELALMRDGGYDLSTLIADNWPLDELCAESVGIAPEDLYVHGARDVDLARFGIVRCQIAFGWPSEGLKRVDVNALKQLGATAAAAAELFKQCIPASFVRGQLNFQDTSLLQVAGYPDDKLKEAGYEL